MVVSLTSKVVSSVELDELLEDDSEVLDDDDSEVWDDEEPVSVVWLLDEDDDETEDDEVPRLRRPPC